MKLKDVLPPDAYALFLWICAEGGKKGNANMTPEQKRARALKANAASHKAKAARKAKLAAEVAQLKEGNQ